MEQVKAKTTPKDFFLWAGAMVALYTSIVAFITLLFSYIDYTFPDVLSGYYRNPYDGGMSYQMAILIVLVPLFLVLMRFIRRGIVADISRAEIWVRRWALVLTIFIAGATIAGDLITLLYYFLSGQDVTVRFLLKVVIVLLVAGGGFVHFLADIRGYWIKNPDRARMVGWGAGALVVASIVAGFFIVGTPWEARQYRLDQQKLSDLQNIQWQIVNYWQQKEKIPTTLADLNDPLSGWILPVNPETGEMYEYAATGKTSFTLCTTFETESDQTLRGVTKPIPVADISGADISDNWAHGEGRVCFDRTIDPERYPPFNK